MFHPQTPSAGEIVTFDASDSYDIDGSVVGYEWDFGDGSSASGQTVQHSYSSAGAYTVTLTVEDDDGLTSTVSREIEISQAEAKLSEIVRHLPAAVEPGSEFTVTLESEARAIGVKITETVPSGFELLGISYDGADSVDYKISGSTITFVVADLAADGFTLSYTLKATDIVGTYTFSGEYVTFNNVNGSISGDETIEVPYGTMEQLKEQILSLIVEYMMNPSEELKEQMLELIVKYYITEYIVST